MSRTPTAPWVKIGGKPGEVAHCLRCGQGLRLGLPADVDVLLAASDAFVKVHARCEPGDWTEPPITTPEEWLASRDTGISSRTICGVMTGRGTPDNPDVPHDPDDFGRCHRLLERFPEWRARLGEVAERFPEWWPFVLEWDELERLYLEELPIGRAPKLYARMQELIGRLVPPRRGIPT